ncbi:MAG: DUF6285 domain-containing protein [Actinomycetota bacterium]
MSDYEYPDSALHGAPSAAELVEAVREWLEADVLDGVDGRLRFHTRVAMNMLATVQRELELGPEQERAHRDRLAALGVETERALADAVRAGDFDAREDELIAALRETVVDRLRVANPRYLG